MLKNSMSGDASWEFRERHCILRKKIFKIPKYDDSRLNLSKDIGTNR